MKTKLYTLLTGLLMAVYLTSYGQEIVNEFNIVKMDKDFWECNLFENEDGTLLFRTVMYTPNVYGDYQHLLYKITPEGEVLDSLTIDAVGDYAKLLRNPIAKNSYILSDDIRSFNAADSTVSAVFRMFFIDEDLNLYDEITVPVIEFPYESYEYFPWDLWFIDTQNDFIISFWTDNIFHMMRIGLDGTIKDVHQTTELFPMNYDQQPQQPNGDSALIYSGMGFGVFTESPLTYYKLGGYYPLSGPWPIVGHFFDADFNLMDTHLYDQFDENIGFDGGNNEHILPFDDNSYIIAVQTSKLSPVVGGVGVAKFDLNHNPICTSPMFGTNNCYPCQTEIVDNNTIYYLYDIGGGWTPQPKWGLARLDGDLNLNWNITLPGNQLKASIGTSLIVLKNGDIVAASLCRKYNRYCATIVTIRDDYDSTPEMTSMNCPFTLYPNPVKDQLTLRFNDGTEPESVELYDLTGRLVGTKRNDLESMDISSMPAGVYILCVTTKGGTSYHKKVLKE